MIDIHNSEVRRLDSKMGTKTALITGASSDIGQAVTTSLAANGFNIAAHYYNNLAAAMVAKNAARKYGVEVGLFRYDLVQPEQQKEWWMLLLNNSMKLMSW